MKCCVFFLGVCVAVCGRARVCVRACVCLGCVHSCTYARDMCGQVVAMNFWPGPIVGFDTNASSPGHGLPTFAPNDPINKAPTGTAAQVYAGWKAQQLKYFPFNLAAYLTVASETTHVVPFQKCDFETLFLECFRLGCSVSIDFRSEVHTSTTCTRMCVGVIAAYDSLLVWSCNSCHTQTDTQTVA